MTRDEAGLWWRDALAAAKTARPRSIEELGRAATSDYHGWERRADEQQRVRRTKDVSQSRVSIPVPGWPFCEQGLIQGDAGG